MREQKIRVLLVDDHVMFLRGLRSLLEDIADFEIVGEAFDAEAVLQQCEKLKPEIVLLDINLGKSSGLDLISEIKNVIPHGNILLLTMYSEKEYLQQALEQGAKGYILKKASDTELITAIRAVGRGETYLDPAIAMFVVDKAFGIEGEAIEDLPEGQALSTREKEVLGLVALGYTNEQIAEELVISIKTVDSHKTHIKKKLELSKRSDLVMYAMKHDLVAKK